MAIELSTIKKSKGALKKRKIVGRGNSSGHGTYATKGLKGQRARAGVSNLKRLGMKKQLLQIPKSRGFRSLYPKAMAISILTINKTFKDNDKINPETLFEKGLIKDVKKPVKILGKDKLTLKGLEFSGVKMSESVKKSVA
ncbi:MAG: 50S ribosomal protein L15 [Candidatus Falkowbacteria bacterium]